MDELKLKDLTCEILKYTKNEIFSKMRMKHIRSYNNTL